MIEPGDVVTALLPGVSETKRRPAVVISTPAYHAARPDVILALIIGRVERADTEFDCALFDWEAAGLKLPSAMRSFLFTKPASQVIKIGRLSDADWRKVRARLKLAVASKVNLAFCLPTIHQIPPTFEISTFLGFSKFLQSQSVHT